MQYEPHYNIQHPDTRRIPHSLNTFVWGGDRRLEERNCFGRFEQFDGPVQRQPNRRGFVESRRGRRRHHLDDIYLPNYEEDSSHIPETSRHYMRSRTHWNNRCARGRTNKKITTSRFNTSKPIEETTSSNTYDVASDTSLIAVGHQSAEITPSSVEPKMAKTVCDEETINIKCDVSVKDTDSLNEGKVRDLKERSVTNIIRKDIESDTETMCLDENDHTVVPTNDFLLKDHLEFSSSTLKKAIDKTERTGNSINKHKKIKSYSNLCEADRKVNGSASNSENCSEQVSVIPATQSNETNKLPSVAEKIVEMHIIPPSAGSTANDKVKITHFPNTKYRRKCSNPKHSVNVEVEKCPHLRDPRLTRKKTPEISEKLEILEWKSSKASNIKDIDKEFVPEPDSPKREEKNIVIDKTNESKKPPSASIQQPNSKTKNSQKQVDPKQNMLRVTRLQEFTKKKEIQYNPTHDKQGLARSFRKDFNPKMNLTQISNYRKEVSKTKGVNNKNDFETHRVDKITNNKKTDLFDQKLRTAPKEAKKNRQVIRSRKVVCQNNRYVFHKFCNNNFLALKFCCHVLIRRGECENTNENISGIANILDFIDTNKSYLPQNICRIEQPKILGLTDGTDNRLKSAEDVQRTLSKGESGKASFEKSEQDDEIQFLAERVKESEGKSCPGQLKKKDVLTERTRVESKALPKERFMKIYETKPAKVSTVDKVVNINDTKVVSNHEKNKKELKCSIKFSYIPPNKQIKKKLYDPLYDSKVSGDKLIEIFGDDLSDVTTANAKGIKRKSVDDVRYSKGLNPSKKIKESTAPDEDRRRTATKRMSLTYEDPILLPKKIIKRRSTIHFSNIYENTNTAQQHIAPVISGNSNFDSETIQLITKEILMTNTTHNVIHLKETETPKNTSADIMDILSESGINSISEPNNRSNVDLLDQGQYCFSNEIQTPSLNSSSTYFGLPDVLPVNILEKAKVLSSPTRKYQRAESIVVEEELAETVAMKCRDNLIEPFIDLTADDENCENFCNVVITNISTNVSTPIEVKSEPDEELLLQVRIAKTPLHDKEIKQEIFSMCELLGDIKREELGENHVEELPLKFASSEKEDDTFWEDSMNYFSEETKGRRSPVIKYQRAESRTVSEELTESVIVKKSGVVITNISTNVSIQVGVKSEPDEKEISLPIGITETQVHDKEMEQEDLSICELLDDIKREEGGSCVKELSLKFATCAEVVDGFNKESIEEFQSPIMELVCAKSSEEPEHLRKADIVPVTQCCSMRQINEHISFGHASSSQKVTQTFPPNQKFNHSMPIRSSVIRQHYLSFYGYVYEILRGYIPLHKVYSECYQKIHQTFRKHPHPLNNFSNEDISIRLIMLDRKKYYGSLLLRDVLRLPENLPGFNFADFLRTIAAQLSKAGPDNVVSHSDLVQHLLELMTVYDREYKQQRTSYKFKMTIEQYHMQQKYRNESSKSESGITERQCELLRTQILMYIQLFGNHVVNLRHGKHVSPSLYPAQNINSNTIVSPTVTVADPLHKMSNMVVPRPAQHVNSSTKNNSALQKSTQNIHQTNFRQPKNAQEMYHQTLENILKNKCMQPMSSNNNLSTSLNYQQSAAYSRSPTISQQPLAHEQAVRLNNDIIIRQPSTNNSQQHHSNNSFSNYITSTYAKLPVAKMAENSSPFEVSMSHSAVSNNTGPLTNRQTPSNILPQNLIKSQGHSKSMHIIAPPTTMAKHNLQWKASSGSYVMNNGETDASSVSTVHGLLAKTHTSGFSVQDNSKTKVSYATCGNSLSRSQPPQTTNLPPSTNLTHTVLPVTQIFENSSLAKPSASNSSVLNESDAAANTNRQFSSSGSRPLNRTSPDTLLMNISVPTVQPIEVKSVIMPKSISASDAAISRNRVCASSSLLQSHSSTNLAPSITLGHTNASKTHSVNDGLMKNDSFSTNTVMVNPLQHTHPPVNVVTSPVIVSDKSEKTPVQTESLDDFHIAAKDKPCATSSLDPYSIDLTSPSIDIKEDDEPGEACEDVVIDLTWMDDFTEEELAKDNNHQGEFVYIKMEPLDDNPAVPPSPGDSGIESPPMQRDSNHFEAGCRSVRVEEEDYPYFFSYQFE